MLYVSIFSVALSLAGANAAGHTDNTGDRFFQNLSNLCDQTYVGQAVEDDDAAGPFGQERLVMHVRECSDSEIKISFDVGDDRSRTWVVTQMDSGLQLKHIHLEEDGTPELLSYYGGMANSNGSEWHQEFPADEYSKDLFTKAGILPSLQNIWTLEIIDQKTFAYDLTRPAYNVRVEFDLKNPISSPTPRSN